MSLYEQIVSLLHKDDQKSTFYRMLCAVVAEFFSNIDAQITKIYNNFYFSSLDSDGCEYYENLLGLVTDEEEQIENRRAKIKAKWLSNDHNSIALIQQVCDLWQYGEAVVDFVDGIIVIEFVGEYGIPDDIDSLKKAIDEVKPAHLGYKYKFKYLLIEDIHEVKTYEEMENLTIEQFMNGVEYE